jgi:hypothetical protein
MTTHRLILGTLICLSAVVMAGSSAGQMRRQNAVGPQPSQGLAPGFDPQEMDRRMRAEAAERSRQFAVERERTRAQMLQNARRGNTNAEAQRNKSIKKAIGATDQQWTVIFPKFDRVRTIMREARYGLITIGYTSGVTSGGGRATGGSPSTGNRPLGGTADGSGMAEGGANAGTSGGGDWNPLGSTENTETNTRTQSGWKWARPSANKGPSELTPIEKAAEDLLDSLENRRSTETEIRAKLAALRKMRDAAAKQLPKAQQELRGVLTFNQQAALTLMGYLD